MDGWICPTKHRLEREPHVRAAHPTGVKLHQGQAASQAELAAALDAPMNKSGYATSLRIGVEALREAPAFWRDQSPEPPAVSQG